MAATEASAAALCCTVAPDPTTASRLAGAPVKRKRPRPSLVLRDNGVDWWDTLEGVRPREDATSVLLSRDCAPRPGAMLFARCTTAAKARQVVASNVHVREVLEADSPCRAHAVFQRGHSTGEVLTALIAAFAAAFEAVGARLKSVCIQRAAGESCLVLEARRGYNEVFFRDIQLLETFVRTRVRPALASDERGSSATPHWHLLGQSPLRSTCVLDAVEVAGLVLPTGVKLRERFVWVGAYAEGVLVLDELSMKSGVHRTAAAPSPDPGTVVQVGKAPLIMFSVVAQDGDQRALSAWLSARHGSWAVAQWARSADGWLLLQLCGSPTATVVRTSLARALGGRVDVAPLASAAAWDAALGVMSVYETSLDARALAAAVRTVRQRAAAHHLQVAWHSAEEEPWAARAVGAVDWAATTCTVADYDNYAAQATVPLDKLLVAVANAKAWLRHTAAVAALGWCTANGSLHLVSRCHLPPLRTTNLQRSLAAAIDCGTLTLYRSCCALGIEAAMACALRACDGRYTLPAALEPIGDAPAAGTPSSEERAKADYKEPGRETPATASREEPATASREEPGTTRMRYTMTRAQLALVRGALQRLMPCNDRPMDADADDGYAHLCGRAIPAALVRESIVLLYCSTREAWLLPLLAVRASAPLWREVASRFTLEMRLQDGCRAAQHLNDAAEDAAAAPSAEVATTADDWAEAMAAMWQHLGALRTVGEEYSTTQVQDAATRATATPVSDAARYVLMRVLARRGAAAWLAPILAAWWRDEHRPALLVRYAAMDRRAPASMSFVGPDGVSMPNQAAVCEACIGLAATPLLRRHVRTITAAIHEEERKFAKEEEMERERTLKEAFEERDFDKWNRGMKDTDYDYDELLGGLSRQKIAALQRR